MIPTNGRLFQKKQKPWSHRENDARDIGIEQAHGAVDPTDAGGIQWIVDPHPAVAEPKRDATEENAPRIGIGKQEPKEQR